MSWKIPHCGRGTVALSEVLSDALADVDCKVRAAMDATVRHLDNVGQGLEEDSIVGIGLVRTSAEVALALVVIADCPLEVLVEAIA